MVRSPINKDARAISGIMLEMNYIAALDKRPETQAYGSRVTRRVLKLLKVLWKAGSSKLSMESTRICSSCGALPWRCCNADGLLDNPASSLCKSHKSFCSGSNAQQYARSAFRTLASSEITEETKLKSNHLTIRSNLIRTMFQAITQTELRWLSFKNSLLFLFFPLLIDSRPDRENPPRESTERIEPIGRRAINKINRTHQSNWKTNLWSSSFHRNLAALQILPRISGGLNGSTAFSLRMKRIMEAPVETAICRTLSFNRRSSQMTPDARLPTGSVPCLACTQITYREFR